MFIVLECALCLYILYNVHVAFFSNMLVCSFLKILCQMTNVCMEFRQFPVGIEKSTHSMISAVMDDYTFIRDQ